MPAYVEAEVRVAHRPLTQAELRSCTLKELRLLARERNLSLDGCLERDDIEQVLATIPAGAPWAHDNANGR